MKNALFLVMVIGFFACTSKTANKTETAVNTAVAKTPEGKLLLEQKSSYEKIPWIDISEAEALNKAQPRKFLVDVYTDWCGPCKMMDRNTFVNQEVIDHISKNFYPVKFNAEGPKTFTFKGKEYGNPNHVPNRRGRNAKHELSSFFAVRGYPTLVIMDENMQIINKIVGYKTPQLLMPEIQQYARKVKG